MQSPRHVHELRVALTVDDFEGAMRLYRDGLGLSIVTEWASPDGRGIVLAAGRATLELIDQPQAAMIDRVEVGERVAGPVRLAFEVEDVDEASTVLSRHGGRVLHDAVQTPWGDRNTRLQAPDGLQLTLFQVPSETTGGDAGDSESGG
jgi:methylmalonyl-CoA/ethylmalonyl-CoA epimerase